MQLKFILPALLIFCLTASICFGKDSPREFYQLKIYRIHSKAQEDRMDAYLKVAYIPALHRTGVKNVGVFKPVETDTTAGKRIYVLIPLASFDQVIKLEEALAHDKKYETDGADYIDAAYDNAAYDRIESVLMQAFVGMTKMATPALTGPRAQRVYELRSYEGPTEKLYVNKVKMFNAGDEVGLFKRLGFNAVFYAEVVSGSHQPNLMYMTTFADMASREEHWKAFVADPQWKTLVAMPEYQHNVSKLTAYLMHPTEYSDY